MIHLRIVPVRVINYLLMSQPVSGKRGNICYYCFKLRDGNQNFDEKLLESNLLAFFKKSIVSTMILNFKHSSQTLRKFKNIWALKNINLQTSIPTHS